MGQITTRTDADDFLRGANFLSASGGGEPVAEREDLHAEAQRGRLALRHVVERVEGERGAEEEDERPEDGLAVHGADASPVSAAAAGGA